MPRSNHLTGRVTAMAAALALIALPAAAQEAQPEAPVAIDVTTAVVGTGVTDREPVGVAESFGADVGRVFFYTVFEGDFPETRIQHVWLREGEETARVALRASGPRWRTWSSKTIPGDWTGDWEVQVVGPNDEVLASTSFTVDG